MVDQQTCLFYSKQISAIFRHNLRDSSNIHIGIGPITHLRTCVIKIVTFKGVTVCYRTELGYFLGLLKFQIFFGVLEIPEMFWGER